MKLWPGPRPGYNERMNDYPMDYAALDDALKAIEEGRAPDLARHARSLSGSILCSLLAHAASLGQTDCAGAMLDAGAPMDVAARGGKTACMLAAEGGHLQCLRLLIERGADVNKSSIQGLSAAGEAVRGNQPDAFWLLLQAGADPSRGSDSALSMAAFFDRPAFFRLAHESGANLGAIQISGASLVWSCAASGSLESLRALLDCGANPNSFTENNHLQSALMQAAENGHVGCAKLLIERGADLHAIDDLGRTALGYAATGNQPDALRLLAGAGAPWDQPDDQGRLPVHLAAERGHVEALMALAELGADPSALDRQGRDCEALALASRAPRAQECFAFCQANACALAIDRQGERAAPVRL